MSVVVAHCISYAPKVCSHCSRCEPLLLAVLAYKKFGGRGRLVKLSEILKRKIVINFVPISLNMCFECSREPSHGSFEYPQHTFWLRNKNNRFE